MKTIYNKALLIAMLMMAVAVSAHSQTFTGPTEQCPNLTSGELYTYSDDVSYSTINWILTGGAVQVSGSGLSRYIKFTADGSITVQLKNAGGTVLSQGTKNVTALVSGTISAPSSTCSGTSVTLTSSGGASATYQWRYSTNGGSTYTTIAGYTGSTAIHTPTTTTVYRRGIPDCHGTSQSNTVTVSIDPVTVAGTLSLTSGNQLCAGSNATLSMSGQTGTIKNWYIRYLDSGGSWTSWSSFSTASSSTNSYTVSVSGALTRTYEFKTDVQNLTCAIQTTNSVSVTAYPPTVAGSITPSVKEHYSNINSGVFTLTSYTGSIAWQKYTGASWTATGVTSNTQSYSDLSQTTSYRAVLTSGVCATATTGTVIVNIYPSPGISASNEYISYGGRSTLSTEAGYASYQWYKNASTISGATSSSYVATGPGTYKVRVYATGATTFGESQDKVILSSFAVTDTDLKRNMVSKTNILTPGVNSATDLYAISPGSVSQTISYTDEYGRPIQIIGIRQSPSGKDLVQPAGYTAQGLIETSYLPYESTAQDGLFKKNAIRRDTVGFPYDKSDQYKFYHGGSGITNDDYPYSVKVTSASPMLTVKEQGSPGQPFQPGGGHTIKTDMLLNTSSLVRKWGVTGISSAYYDANKLVVSQVTDPNGHKVLTFTDMLGQLILKKVEADGNVESIGWLETYFIYDEYGRVKYQLPPKAVNILGSGGTIDASNSSIEHLIFKYTYDGRGRLTQKKVPGKDVEYYVYDVLDRLVLTQDGNLRAAGKWFFTKYDFNGRAVYSGLYANNGSLSTVQAAVDAVDYSTTWYEVEQVNATYKGYSNSTFPTSNTILLSVSYYDHYDFDRNESPDYTYDNTHLSGQESAASSRTRGLTTGSSRVIINSDETLGSWLATVVFYDQYDRPVQTQGNNPQYVAGLDVTTTIYDFVRALKTKTTHRSCASVSLDITDRTDVDAAGRVTKVFRKIGETEQAIAEYVYNPLGQVTQKKLHKKGDNSFIQTVDFSYTIGGALKKINDPGSIGADFFAEELLRNESLGGMSHQQAWNGNITAVKWKDGFGSNVRGATKTFSYQYHKNDQLKEARYAEGTSFSSNTNAYNEESITYDANGNLSTLQRKGKNDLGVTTTIDNLAYTYSTTNANSLLKVEDSGTTHGFNNGATDSNEYTYDANGNSTKDKNKDITAITYNSLNKVKQVTFGNGRILKYAYDAAGMKIKMEESQSSTLLKTTTYVGGFVYENDTLKFFASPEGRVIVNNGDYEYQYAISDHQGNTRTVFTSREETLDFTATFETTVSGLREDTDLFENTGGANEVTFNSANHTAGGNRAVRLNNSFRAGPALMLRVFPGDKVDAQVYAYHESNSGFSSTATLANMITAIAGAFGGVSGGGGESGSIYSTFQDALGVIGLGPDQGSTRPTAFLNFIFLDDQPGFDGTNQADSAGYILVPEGAYMNKTLMQLNLPAFRATGFIYIYLSYEDESTNYVYFDDLKISYQKSQVVQHNSYYAFGMTAESWTRFDTKPNQYLYNAGSELNAKTGSYEMYFRNYDPAIARMSGVDVMAESYASLTPYQYANNDPVYWNDPTGAYAGGDEWWNAPREMWRGGMDPQQRREQERFYANESTGTSVDPFAWTGIKTSDIYGRGANTFGSGYLPGDYYGTARLGMEYDVYEVWMDYYTNGRYDESVFKGYRYEEKNRAFYPTGNKIVGNYDFAKTGNGWTAEITGLGVGAVNTKPKQIVLVELGSLCITIKPVGPNTKQAASDAFVKSWNTMTDRLDSWLNAQGDRLITTPELQRQIMLIFNTQLNMNTLYSSTSLGPCSGSIPVTPAQYSSWWDDIFK